MSNCLDCANFKMKKGWKVATCSVNLILRADPPYKPRLFNVIRPTDGKPLLRLAMLNRDCGAFEGMD